MWNAGAESCRKECGIVGIDELRNSVNGIRMKEEMRKAIIENVKERTEVPGESETGQKKNNEITAYHDREIRKGMKKNIDKNADKDIERNTGKAAKKSSGKGTKKGWRKNLAAAALVVVVVGVAAVPVRAFVNSIVKERMEEMPQEEKDTYVETMKEQKTEADGYTRSYTESEESRYQELVRKYQEGTFPENEVVQVDSEEEAGAYEFCYLKPTSVFCLPERELTDEEMLEIIDFKAKREYSYNEEYAKEHAEEIAAKEEQEKAEIADNVENGGITEEEAVKIAVGKLSEVFGMTEDGFERNSYYNESVDDKAANYCVNWSNILSHQYYYFYIDAKDGHMIWAAHSGEDLLDGRSVTLTRAQAQEKIPQLQAKAREFMKNTIRESYDRVYVYYLVFQDGSVSGDGVRFYFAREDQSACAVTYTWDGTMYEFEERSISGLEDGAERTLSNRGEKIKLNVVFQELEE